jgi:hypothetical protein
MPEIRFPYKPVETTPPDVASELRRLQEKEGAYDSALRLVAASGEYELFKHIVGPGKAANLHGARGKGKTALAAYMAERIAELPNGYVLTNMVFNPVPRYDNYFAHKHQDPADDHRSYYKCRPNASPIVDWARIHTVYSTLDLLRQVCQIRSRWIHSLGPLDKRRYFASMPIESTPWIAIIFDEAGQFMSKMRAMSEGNLVMQSWMDLIRKIGGGMVNIWHSIDEPPWFLRNWFNKNAEIVKKSHRTAIVQYKAEGLRVTDLVTVRWEGIPKPHLPFDTNSQASFEPVFFPGSDFKFSPLDVYRLLQKDGVISWDAPDRILEMLDAAEEEEAKFSKKRKPPMQLIHEAITHKRNTAPLPPPLPEPKMPGSGPVREELPEEGEFDTRTT